MKQQLTKEEGDILMKALRNYELKGGGIIKCPDCKSKIEVESPEEAPFILHRCKCGKMDGIFKGL